MKQTIKLKESQLRQMIRESIMNALNEGSVVISDNKISDTSSVHWGEDNIGFYAWDDVTNDFRRFPTEQQAKQYAEELHELEKQRTIDGRKWMKK